MRFLKLIIENYKSFQLPTGIDFTHGRPEPTRNVFLIGGMNNAGKTSILEAINICLYGEKKDRIFKSINRQEMARGNASCSFELHMETDELETVVVQRSWSCPVSVNKPKANQLEERLIVSKNGKRVSVANQKMWQEYLEATIPRGITQFFFFDGEKIQEMVAEEHAEIKLKASMEAALGIEFIRKLIDDLTYLRNEERRSRTEITDEDIRLKENGLAALRLKQGKQQKRRDEVQEDISSFNEELEERRKRFLSFFGFEAEDLRESKRKERDRIRISNRLQEIDQTIRNLAGTVLPLALLGGKLSELRQQIDAESQARKQSAIHGLSKGLIKALAKEIQDFETEVRKKPLSEAEFGLLQERLTGVVRDFGPGKERQTAIKELLKLSDADSARILVRIEEVERQWNGELERMLLERQELKIQSEDLEQEIQRKQLSEADRELFGQLQSEVESYSSLLGRKREEMHQIENDLIDISESIASRERELEMLYSKYETSREQEKFLTRIGKLIELLNEYMRVLRETKIARLQESTFEMFKRLAGKGDLVSDLQIDPKTYLITIRDRQGNVIQKQNLSAGEKEVFAISLLWGLAQTSQLTIPIVVDTPLSRLDSAHRDKIINHYFPNAGHQVIVLSTDTEVDQNYYRQLEPCLQYAVHLVFDKHRELTTVEEGYFWSNS